MSPSRLSARRLSTLMLVLSAVAMALPAAPALARGWSSERVQGSGTIQLETRALAHFNGVALGLPGQLTLHIGSTESVTIETDANLLPLIETSIENGMLQIRTSKRNLDIETHRLKIVVQARAVDRLVLGGSGAIESDPLRSASKITVELGGSGSINVKGVDSEALTVSVGGSGKLKVGGGAVSKLTVSLAGSGDVDLARLQSIDASVNVAGSGETKIAVRDRLSVAIAGSGDVNYYGDPKVSKTVIGSGSTHRIGAAAR